MENFLSEQWGWLSVCASTNLTPEGDERFAVETSLAVGFQFPNPAPPLPTFSFSSADTGVKPEAQWILGTHPGTIRGHQQTEHLTWWDEPNVRGHLAWHGPWHLQGTRKHLKYILMHANLKLSGSSLCAWPRDHLPFQKKGQKTVPINSQFHCFPSWS